MLKNLIIDAFERVKVNLKDKGLSDPSNNNIAQNLSDHLLDDHSISITKKSLTNYHKDALKAEMSNLETDIKIPQLEVVLGLCKYLGYENYRDYVEENTLKNNDVIYHNTTNNSKSSITIKTKNKGILTWVSTVSASKTIVLSLITIGIIGAGTFVYLSSDNSRWMVWKDYHYEEVEFDSKKLSDGSLKLYNENRITNFKEIIADCDTKYYNADGSVRIWYGKDKDGNVDCFTSLGKHPETGKTLKEITPYMINKYFCPKSFK